MHQTGFIWQSFLGVDQPIGPLGHIQLEQLDYITHLL